MAVGVLLALTAMIFNTEATYFVYNSEQAFFLITGGLANAIAMNMCIQPSTVNQRQSDC
jgi:hypothetical protein